MATTKVTFTLDDSAILQLADAASRLSRSRSEIVRLAIDDYYSNLGRMSRTEQARMLKAFDELVPAIKPRSAAETDRELAQIRLARRTGGRAGKSAGTGAR